MRWRLFAPAIVLLGALSGCGSSVSPVGRAVVGQWLVVSVDGKPVPQGATIEVDYKPDGQVTIETTGDLGSVRPPDKAKLKEVMDRSDLNGSFTTLFRVNRQDFQVEMRRKPGTSEMPGR